MKLKVLFLSAIIVLLLGILIVIKSNNMPPSAGLGALVNWIKGLLFILVGLALGITFFVLKRIGL